MKCSSVSRCHHLIKTFYATLGWHDEQRPDGTIVLRSPTGHTYTTTPHGADLYPTLAQSTGDLPPPPALDLTDISRTAMMARRKQTREQARQARITNERRQRAELNEITRNDRKNPYFPSREPPPSDNDPPPF